jgi:hypothetical protein
MTATSEPNPLTIQMLAFLASRPRTYDETMDAWRTSCPRLSIWEDALADGLVVVRPPHGGEGRAGSLVEVTARGCATLGDAGPR